MTEAVMYTALCCALAWMGIEVLARACKKGIEISDPEEPRTIQRTKCENCGQSDSTVKAERSPIATVMHDDFSIRFLCRRCYVEELEEVSP